jgi:hypothetical protein
VAGNTNEQINKKDLEVFLEVNKKAIEIEAEMVEQNEEIISLLNAGKKQQDVLDSRFDDVESQNGDTDAKIDKLIKQTEEISKDLFKIQVLFVTGLLSLVIQIIQIFVKK